MLNNIDSLISNTYTPESIPSVSCASRIMLLSHLFIPNTAIDQVQTGRAGKFLRVHVLMRP